MNPLTDFSFILALMFAITGAIWLLNIIWRLLEKYVTTVSQIGETRRRLKGVVEFSKVFFLLMLIVYAFALQSFRIPSGSMLPTLEIGDFILVNQYQYAIRIPILNKKVIDVNEPDYGDVMVFRFPKDETENYIKRVVGLPGDSVVYENKKISINGQSVAQNVVDDYVIESGPNRKTQTKLLSVSLESGESYQILHDERQNSRTFIFKVPENTYFVLGDNRDYSKDSRSWGFVPEENILGKAFFIWFSWSSSGKTGVNWNRIATAIE